MTQQLWIPPGEYNRNKLPVPGTPAGNAARQAFISEIQKICGDVRFLYVPVLGDTTTSTSADLNARTITHAVSQAARMTAQGSGVLESFDGVADYSSMPDADNLSLGDTLVDQPMSGFVLATPTDMATWRWLFAKKLDTTGVEVREFGFGIDTADKLILELWDESANAVIANKFNTALTMATQQLLGFSYDGSGANSGIVLYRNAAALAFNAGTTTGTYVAMEPSTDVLHMGANTGAAAIDSYYSGTMGVRCLTAKVLTAVDHWNIKAAVNALYGTSL